MQLYILSMLRSNYIFHHTQLFLLVSFETVEANQADINIC